MIIFKGLLFFTLYGLLLAYTTWVLFVAIVSLRAARKAGRLTKPMIPFSYLTLAIGLPMDAVLNLFASIPFLELPQYQRREILFTSRLKRLVKEGGWRATQAHFWCRNFLEPIDPRHCSKSK